MNAEYPGPLIKICGVTRLDDAASVLDSGADAIGLMFYRNSPRHVSVERAIEIAAMVSDRLLKVGLFVNNNAEDVREIIGSVPLDILQFHGDEDAAFCRQFRRPYWKAVRVRKAEDVARVIAEHQEAAGILADAWDPVQHGGTGKTFDWRLLENLPVGQQLILAGGLSPENVSQAITTVRPWAVDVSSGVEESPGIKSRTKIIQFVNEVRRV